MFGHRNDLKPTRIWLVSALDEDNDEIICRAFRYKCEAISYHKYLYGKENIAIPSLQEVMLY